jgi:hypothetical protein
MKTFNQFIQEDFNSPKATQISLDVLKATGRKGVTAKTGALSFFEALPKRSFNLLRYLKSFDTEEAKTVLGNNMGYWRGLIFNSSQEFLIFVWKGILLHHQIAYAINNQSGMGKIPALKYEKAYNTMNLLDPGETIDNNWCFPLVYLNGQIRTNLSPVALEELEKQKGVKALFQLDDMQFSKLLKDDM